jgi:transcriptional regulator with XRE-family HTH domain
MRNWRVIVGRNVKALRLTRGLTQERLAFASDLDLTYIGGIERGRRNPSLLAMVRIADALGTSVAELVTPKDD